MGVNNQNTFIDMQEKEKITIQELPKQKKDILKKTKNLITAVALSTAVILTSQKSAKSDDLKPQDNLKPLKLTTFVVEKEQNSGILLDSGDNRTINDNSGQIKILGKNLDQTHQENLKELDKVDLPEEIKKSLVGLSDENRKLRQEGKSNLEYPVKIQAIKGIKTKKDLDFIVNSGSLTKQQTFKEITGIDSLIRKDKDGDILIDDQFFKDWEMINSKLFDTSDISNWLRVGEDKKEMTKEQIQDYKDDMAKTMERWKTKINYWYVEMNEWDKENGKPEGTTFGIFFEDGLNLFENAINKTIFPSREILRRQEVNAFSISYYKVLPKRSKHIFRPDVVNQVSEYVLLINKDVIAVKTQIGQFKYLTLDGKLLKNIKGLESIQDVFIEAVNGYGKEYIQTEKLAGQDKRLAQLDREIAQLDKDNEQLDKDNEQLDKDNEQLDKDNEQLDKLNNLSKEIIELSALYTQTGDIKHLKKAHKNIKELKQVKVYLEDMKNREKSQKIIKSTTKAISNLEIIIENFDKNYGNLVATI